MKSFMDLGIWIWEYGFLNSIIYNLTSASDRREIA